MPTKKRNNGCVWPLTTGRILNIWIIQPKLHSPKCGVTFPSKTGSLKYFLEARRGQTIQYFTSHEYKFEKSPKELNLINVANGKMFLLSYFFNHFNSYGAKLAHVFLHNNHWFFRNEFSFVITKLSQNVTLFPWRLNQITYFPVIRHHISP